MQTYRLGQAVRVGKVHSLDLLQLIKKMQELPAGKLKGRGGGWGGYSVAYIILTLQDLIL